MSREPRKVNIAGLDVIEIFESVELPTVVLLHGYGASAMDLFPLQREMPQMSGARVNWIFPQGPIAFPVMPGFNGYAWFQIDLMKLQTAISRGETAAMAEFTFPGMRKSQEKLKNLFEEKKLDLSKCFLGGFSQGAMLTTDFVLENNLNPLGLVLLSGTLCHKKSWVQALQKKTPFDYFQSHGSQDPVLPIDLARELDSLLQKYGARGHLREFRGAHEIPEKIITELDQFLWDRVTSV